MTNYQEPDEGDRRAMSASSEEGGGGAAPEPRRCHMPCPSQGCNGRCDKLWGHGPPHSCPTHSDF